MYPVSKAFQEAIRKPERITKVGGVLSLKGGKNYEFGEEAIVQGSLQIVDQMVGGKFGLGGAYSRNMSIKLNYKKIEDLEGVNINLTNAIISLWFSLRLESGEDETIQLGVYLVDGTKSSRKFGVLSLSASDYLMKLNVPSRHMSNATPYQIFSAACGLAYMGTGNTQAEIDAFPNGTKQFSFDTARIQNAWDMAMWVSAVTGTFVRASRKGEPCPQLVQIPIKYTQSGTAGNFDLATFKEDNGSIIPANVRIQTEFTDTSIRNTTILMNHNGAMIKSHGDWTFAPDTLEGTIELSSNALLSNKTDEEVKEILDDLRLYADDLRFCPFKTTFNGNPAIEVGDYVYLEPGGAVDETKFFHYGIVTYSKWIYRGKCEIRCASDVTAERPDTAAASSVAKVNGMQRSATDNYSTKAKSQIEKRIDAIEGNTSELVGNFGGRYVFKWTNPYCLEAFDGNGNSMAKFSLFPLSLERGDSHIKLGNDYIEIKNAEMRGKEFSFYIHENGQTRITDSSGNDVFSIVPSGGLMEYKVGTQSFQIWLNTGEIKMNGKTVWAPWMA